MTSAHPHHSDHPSLSIATILSWLRTRAFGLYGGEPVTQLQHALQCATLSHAAGAPTTLTVAALLHDLGHLAETAGDTVCPHGPLAAALLGDLFPAAVTAPIRLHIDAKRYLCATEPQYWASLSTASKQSLEWQGGAFTASEALTFFRLPHAQDAIQLRRWDDAAKVPGAVTLGLEEFAPLLVSVALPAGARVV